MDISYILNHLGEDREHYFNAVAPPIIQSSNFCFKDVNSFRLAIENESKMPIYSRGCNPTVTILRKKLAALEGADDALVFASGSAAIASAVMSCVKGGDHVICVNKPYSWTTALLNDYLVNYNVTTTMVDGTHTENFEKAILPNTKLIVLESPNTFTLELQDLEAISKIAKKHGITTMIDNSYSTPLNQKPLALGIDIVVYSGSKYFGGHSDLVAGVICSSKERIHEIFSKEFMTLGAIISPHDAWLMLRGIRTLELRVNRSAESAQKVVNHLEKHPKIEKVFYPFASKNEQLSLAKKQMKQGSGLLTVLIKAKSVEDIETFCNSLKCFLLAVSWGGHESLIFPICAGKAPYTLPWNMVRLYIGLENPEELIADIDNALDKI
ncbi:MAG: aminotransferase class I/II-fold pyridoxal phosphate-dependent enzyme [Bacteroidetes bacterium]|nr:aminotransferase class I/II-fold pyridoxal phosphate-dependent enzyme [Bacteroidota bacterium]